MRVRWAVAPCVLAAGILAACSLSLDGYSNGAAATNDGGGTSDARATQTSNDGGTSATPDGASGDGSAEASVNLCAQPNLYCTTFDDNSLAAVSLKTTKSAGAVVEVTDGSAHCSVPANSGGNGNVNATFVYPVDTDGLTFAVDVDLFVTSPDWASAQGGNANVFELSIDGNDHQGFELYINSGDASVTTTYQSSQFLFDPLSQNIPYDQWFHVRIDANFKAGNGSYKLTVNGQAVANREAIAFSAEPSPAQLGARVGVVAVNPPTPPLDVRTDNLIITTE